MVDDPKSGNFANNSLILAALLSVGALVLKPFPPLEGERPPASVAQLHEAASAQDLDARLWQDPFSVVAAADAYLAGCRDSHGVNHCETPRQQLEDAGDLEQKTPPAAVPNGGKPDAAAALPTCGAPGEAMPAKLRTLWVTMSGAPYFAEEEQRRRFRYAVVSALDARGFAPANPTHIGYFHPHRMQIPEPVSCRDGIVRVASPESGGQAVGVTPHVEAVFPQDRIPFELFEEQPKKANPGSGEEQSKQHAGETRRIVVVWIDEDLLRKRPLTRLCELAHEIGQPAAIIGPQTSDILLDLRMEEECPLTTAGVPFYAYGATMSEEEIKEYWTGATKGGEQGSKINLIRTVSTDESVARALREELRLRGVDPCASEQLIATISESDTFYGRSLPATVQSEFVKGEDGQARKNCHPGGFLQKKYLRGLDGGVAQAANAAKGKTGGSAGATNKDVKGDSDSKDDEKPLGLSQRDYLRRMADDLKRRQDESGRSIEAIGVLGNDVFDKLMILRALRPEFPEALFFTTDYDAALALKNELSFTRNLIVASSFGPQLRLELQGDIPPLRDVYETSVFLATQIAAERALSPKSAQLSIPQVIKTFIDDAPKKEDGAKAPSKAAPATNAEPTAPEWPPSPRVFEVQRTGEFLALPPVETPPSETVQPKTRPFYAASVDWLLAPALLCLVYGLASLWRASPTKWRGVGTAFVALLPFIILVAWAAALSRLDPSNSPAASIDGPLILLVFIIAARHWLDAQDSETRSAFFAMFWPAAALCFALGGALSWLFWRPTLAGLLTEDGTGAGEPMAFVSGVSVWPALLLRIFTLFLSMWLILLAFHQLKKNFDELCQRFKLIGNDWGPREIIENYPRKGMLPHWLDVRHFYKIAPETEKGKFEIEKKEWETIVLNAWGAHRIARVLVFWGPTTFVFLGLLFHLFGPPLNPSRGNLMRRFYEEITLLDVFAMWFLIFLVVDATLFLGLFVWRLSHSQTTWPGQVRLEFKHKLNLHDGLNVGENEILDDWIDLQFIAERTKCVNSLVWYPFAIVSLMIVSRSPLFANFPLSPPIAIAQGVGLFLIFACAFALNLFAEDQRKSAQRNLHDEITRARNQGDDAREKRWQGLLDRVTDLHEGSFRNFLQQPVVAGMLLPLLSVGWTQLLERGQLFGL